MVVDRQVDRDQVDQAEATVAQEAAVLHAVLMPPLDHPQRRIVSHKQHLNQVVCLVVEVA